jgi:hypothetical protein
MAQTRIETYASPPIVICKIQNALKDLGIDCVFDLNKRDDCYIFDIIQVDVRLRKQTSHFTLGS